MFFFCNLGKLTCECFKDVFEGSLNTKSNVIAYVTHVLHLINNCNNFSPKKGIVIQNLIIMLGCFLNDMCKIMDIKKQCHIFIANTPFKETDANITKNGTKKIKTVITLQRNFLISRIRFYQSRFFRI